MPNLHSQAFQRAMAGAAERGGPAGDSFWSWRELMSDNFLAKVFLISDFLPTFSKFEIRPRLVAPCPSCYRFGSTVRAIREIPV